jgi:L-amino acid N-acyltransferase YncA
MKLRKAEYGDYEAIVDMYVDLIDNVYPERRKAPKMKFYSQVLQWFTDKEHIRVVEKDGEVIAFALCIFDNARGVTETVYHAEIAYVKPKFQKSKAVYLLYNDIVNWAIENDFVLQTSSIPENGVAKIIEKRFNSQLRFQTYSQRPEVVKQWMIDNNYTKSSSIKF